MREPALDVRADRVDVEGLLGDQDDVGAAGEPGVQGDPAGVPAHHLDDQDAVVGLGGGVQPVDRLHRDVDRGVEAEGVVGGGEVVVDGLGTPTTLTPSSASLVATPRVSSPPIAISASTPLRGEVLLDPLDAALDLERVGARRLEDRAAAGQDAADLAGRRAAR